MTLDAQAPADGAATTASGDPNLDPGLGGQNGSSSMSTSTNAGMSGSLGPAIAGSGSAADASISNTGGMASTPQGDDSGAPSMMPGDPSSSAGDAGQSTCDVGRKICNGACIPEMECCTEVDCPPGAACEAGACVCSPGQHLCTDGCAEDASPLSCGTACEPCPEPKGGSAECVDGECVPACPGGQKVCLGECIAEDRSCEGECPIGAHDCSGNCVPNDSVMSCGTSCRACPTPRGGSATCDGDQCGMSCNGSAMLCGDSCQPECCDDGDCSRTEACVSGRCECQPQCGTKRCGPDGCNGTCGRCSSDETCNSAGQCECVPRCNGTQCGSNSDGCNGQCECRNGMICSASGTCEQLPELYEECEPDGAFGQGNCRSGQLCVGIAGTGSACYSQGSSSSCLPNFFAALNRVCVQECDPPSSSEDLFPNCPNRTHCIVNGEAAADPVHPGYCVAN